MEATVALLVSQFLAAIADGNVDSKEIKGMLDTLMQLVPRDKIFDKIGRMIEDLLTRDAEELRDAAKRKRGRANELQNSGRTAKASELIAEAVELERKAGERDAKEAGLKADLTRINGLASSFIRQDTEEDEATA